MQDLRLVAANESGTHLVLRSQAGDKYLLTIDDRLRAAVRGDRARLGQLEIEQGGQLRPRDIQARIRAGATAEQVAQSAGVPVERVRRFEGPVLAEREHMAQMAQRGAVRRPNQPEGRAATLGEALDVRLDPLRVKPEDLGWDSWRREDGRWLVQLAFDIAGDDDTCRAQFLYDPRARTVVAENDQGRWLTGELDARPPRAPFVPRLARKLVEQDAPDELHTDMPSSIPAAIRGDHPAGRRRGVPDVVATRPAPDVVARQAPPAPPVAPKAPAVPVAPPAARQSPAEPAPPAASPSIPPLLPPRSATPAAPGRPKRIAPLDYLVPPVPNGPEEAPVPPRREPVRPAARRPGIRPETGPRPKRRSVMDLPPVNPAPSRGQEPVEERRTGTHDSRGGGLLAGAASGSSSRSRRAAVPSWDDILFGTRRRD